MSFVHIHTLIFHFQRIILVLNGKENGEVLDILPNL